jgi:hypothetical protein
LPTLESNQIAQMDHRMDDLQITSQMVEKSSRASTNRQALINFT